jgi:hypothetical protein
MLASGTMTAAEVARQVGVQFLDVVSPCAGWTHRHCRECDASRRLMAGLNVGEIFNAEAHGIRERRALTAYTQQSECAGKVTEIRRMMTAVRPAARPMPDLPG